MTEKFKFRSNNSASFWNVVCTGRSRVFWCFCNAETFWILEIDMPHRDITVFSACSFHALRCQTCTFTFLVELFAFSLKGEEVIKPSFLTAPRGRCSQFDSRNFFLLLLRRLHLSSSCVLALPSTISGWEEGGWGSS